MTKYPKIEGTVSSSYFSSALKSCVSAGCDLYTLLKRLNFRQDPSRYPYKRVSADIYLKMLHYAEEMLGEPGIGVKIGQEVRPQTFNDVGYATISCDTIEQAVNLTTKYQRITQEIGRITLEQNEEEAALVWHSDIEDPEYLRPMTDVVFSGYFVLGHWLAWMDVGDIKTRIQFKHDETPYADIYRQVFKAELEFNAPRNAMISHPALPKMELPQKNPELVKIITKRLDEALLQLDNPDNIVGSVYDAIESHLPDGAPPIGMIAKNLGMSERTLRRRLESEDVNFRDLLKIVRQNSCEIYLRESSVSLAELAQKLGFKEQSSFTHAFKSWYGVSPRDYIKGLEEK